MRRSPTGAGTTSPRCPFVGVDSLGNAGAEQVGPRAGVAAGESAELEGPDRGGAVEDGDELLEGKGAAGALVMEASGDHVAEPVPQSGS